VSTIDTTTEPRQPKRLEKKIIGRAPFDGITVRKVFDCPVTWLYDIRRGERPLIRVVR